MQEPVSLRSDVFLRIRLRQGAARSSCLAENQVARPVFLTASLVMTCVIDSGLHVRSHEERRRPLEETTQSRKSPSILEYAKIQQE